MISFTSAQLDAWLAALIYPMARVLELMAAAPVFNNTGAPVRTRLLVGFALTIGVFPAVPPLPPIDPGSGTGLAILAQQILIGLALGFTLRLVFTAIDFAGELTGLQMGLSFAVFFDPQTSSQTSVVADFLGLLGALVFLAIDGHLVVVAGLAKSFTLFPIGAGSFAPAGLTALVRWGGVLFSAGVLLSLPLIAALLITNIALGVLTRTAPQLNLFAVGFPVTLLVGFAALFVSLSYIGPVFQQLFERGFEAMETVLGAAVPAHLR
jgi:flagellar biosynthetic protein FliR